tara:strand:- start:8132 stop:8902 length:771 start_codon:yes stop_codon:yes gene_type:complete
MDPYLPVRTVEILAGDEIQTGLARPELQVDGIWEPIKNVSFSKQYNLLPNERVREIGDRFAERNGYKLVKEHFTGRQFNVVYMSDSHKVDNKEIGTINKGAMFSNSYDKSISFRMQALALVEVCTNGMTSNKWFPFFKFNHNANLDDNLEKMEEQMDVYSGPNGTGVTKFNQFCDAILPVSKLKVNKENLTNIRNQIPRMTPNNFGKIIDLYLKRNPVKDSMWELLNAGTEHYWHNKTDINMNRQWVDAFVDIAKS